ncbi:flagellar hook-associated protein 3 [Clostridium bovifaecis]|uniref:Flagellar hook-associated protein 3 n=1 Tax=Clostridium bovifaecis TaxID=2184719 RepID=A0A6I6F1A7_9CLOT|nr:flagellar hook-associated protein 3 [Clostridium bovifaecis]
MRVTNKMLSNSFLTDMRSNLENMRKLQQQMTSGKEIRRPSDDPFKVARAMQLHTDISTNKQYNENISDTINWLDTTDTALGQIGDVLQRVRELLVSAGNAGYSDSERRAIKNEINEKVGEVSQILNTNFDGSYIFGGTRGTTKPVDTLGGTGLESAESGVIDLSAITTSGKLSSDIQIKLGFDVNEKTITIPANTEVNSLSDLANKINDKINEASESWLQGKIKAMPDIANKTIKFVNINDDSSVTNNIFKVTSASLGMDTAVDAKYDPSNVSNTRLIYYKKAGGEIVDGNEYNQIGSKLKVQISQGVVMDYNVTATEVLQFKNEKGEDLDLREIFSSIINHLDGKDLSGTVVDKDSVQKLVGEDLQNITDTINNLLKIRSEVGAKQNRMDSAKEKNVDATFNMTEILSKTEDIDITEKTMEYATMQTVYIAALQTSAKVLQPSLMDYL